MSEVFIRPRRWPRIALLAALSLLLHLALLDWGKSHLLPAAQQAPEQAFTVTLKPVPPPTQPVSLPQARPQPPKRAAPKKPARPSPALDAIHAPVEVPDQPIRETVTPIYAPAVATADQSASGDGQGDGSPTTQASADAKPEAKSDTSTGTHYQTSPPPTAKLSYDVRATYNQLPVQGYGTLDWHTDGNTYRLDGKAEDFLFTFLNFSSTGAIDDFGVSPELYTEKRMRRAATNTHFNRERQQISFSASTAQYPRQGGEQDRASLIWQLAAIGRGDAGKFVPGAVIDMFVAGARDGELWRIQVLGQEDIKVPAGDLRTWHVVRMPKPGSYDQRIDIWLAPLHEWYPVRLRYTDTRTDGDYLEMSLSKLQQ